MRILPRSVLIKLVCCLVFPAFLSSCSESVQPLGSSLVIGNVTVIDPESRRVEKRRDVHIRDGYITAIKPADSALSDSPGYIDASGKFLIPGLMDMHVHLAHPMFSEITLALLLANGVTGVREMSGDCWEPRGEIFACIDDYRELQADIEAGRVRGPHIERLSSAIVRGPSGRRQPHVPDGAPAFVTPENALQASHLANFLEGRGIDIIKTYNGLSRDAYFTLADRARAAELEIAGHVPLSVTVIEASEYDHRTVEHAQIIPRDCSRLGADLRVRSERWLTGDREMKELGTAERLNGIIDTFDQARCQHLLDVMAENDTYYVPTHETREMDARASESAYRDDPRLIYVYGMLRQFWEQDLRSTVDVSSPEDVEAYRNFFQHGLMITKLAFESGVDIMAGTDANDTMSIPGFSLHDELLHLENSGIPPMDVLRSATTVPAAYLAKSHLLGGIVKGKRADLLLLDANPLDAIANTTAISALIFRGEWLDRDALDRLLEDSRLRAEG